MERIMEDKIKIAELFIGDIHSGSVTALLPANAKRFDGQIDTSIPQNKMQRWLWKNYLDDLSQVGKIDVLVNMGDSTEGQQLKIFGRTLASTDTDMQVRWATECFQKVIDMCKPKYVLTVSGTPYHVLTSGCTDLQVHTNLEKSNPDIRFIFGAPLVIKIGKLTYSIAHPFPTTQNKSPPLEKLIDQHASEFYHGKTPRINVFARGHAHAFYWTHNDDGVYSFIVPCQQPTSEFGRNKPYLTVRRPDVGMLQITQSDEDLIPHVYLHKWQEY